VRYMHIPILMFCPRIQHLTRTREYYFYRSHKSRCWNWLIRIRPRFWQAQILIQSGQIVSVHFGSGDRRWHVCVSVLYFDVIRRIAIWVAIATWAGAAGPTFINNLPNNTHSNLPIAHSSYLIFIVTMIRQWR